MTKWTNSWQNKCIFSLQHSREKFIWFVWGQSTLKADGGLRETNLAPNLEEKNEKKRQKRGWSEFSVSSFLPVFFKRQRLLKIRFRKKISSFSSPIFTALVVATPDFFLPNFDEALLQINLTLTEKYLSYLIITWCTTCHTKRLIQVRSVGKMFSKEILAWKSLAGTGIWTQ